MIKYRQNYKIFCNRIEYKTHTFIYIRNDLADPTNCFQFHDNKSLILFCFAFIYQNLFPEIFQDEYIMTFIMDMSSTLTEHIKEQPKKMISTQLRF